jgi:MFS family permease
VALAFLLGTANAFDAPARVSFTLEMVDREDLTNAIALNATMFNTATAVGPAAAGLAYAALGPAWCFTLNGLSFIAVISALLLMKLKPVAPKPRVASAYAEAREGARFVKNHPVIRALIALMAGASVFGLAFVTLFPAWSVTILQGDAATNGYLQSARGVGALIAALMIASLGRFQFKGKMITVGSFSYPVMILLFAQMRWLPLSLGVLLGAGWGMITMFNLSNALMQTLTPDHLRGRVASIFTLSFFGLMPVGALIAGFTAERLGAVNTVIGTAIIALIIAAVIFWRVPQVRRAL